MNEQASTSPASVRRRPVPWPIRLLLGLGMSLLAVLLTAAIGVGIALVMAYPNLPEIEALTDYQPKQPMRIFSAEGVLLGEFGDERRQFTPIHEIPQIMKDAVLAIEDARFYQHGGVDTVGVLRAAIAQIGSGGSQGASTITMQVARNFYLPTEKTLTRKLYEILLALKIENHLSKDQILEVYMNQIYLGQRAHGFAAASEIYFGKPLREITIAEAAMLAGLPKAPSAYNPIVNPKRATVRQRYIISRMLENGFINQQQHDEALHQVLTYRKANENSVHAEYAIEAARQLVFAQFGQETYTRGLQVHLTILADQQIAAYKALRKNLLEYERRQFYRGPEGYIELDGIGAGQLDARITDALIDHPDHDELKAAVVTEVSPKKVVVSLMSGDSLPITGEGLKPVTTGLSDKADPKIRIRKGSIVRVIQAGPKGEWFLTQQPEVEGAFIAMDPKSGELRAMVGGFDFSKSKFNHVTQAWRQPGSSFKPFIYSAALEKGFTPSTIVNDTPLFFDAGTTGSQPWEPKNYDGTFDGPMPLRRALAKSKNMVSIRVLRAIGVDYAREWISRFGFDKERHDPYLTMALGAGSATPLQMVSAYSVFANGGFRVEPRLIAKVTDNRGRILQVSTNPVLDDSSRVIDARNAFLMSSLLQEVTRSGTAARAQATLRRTDLYGKTGTTNDSMDAWFAGYQPSLAAVVWIGHDNPRKLGDRETGGGLALPVWIDYMSFALKNVPVTEISPPEGVVQINGEWYFEEYTHNQGVSSLGTEDKLPEPASVNEKKGVLDLFR